MPKFVPINIPQVDTVKDLRDHTVSELQRISQRIAQQSNQTGPFSMGNFRITDLANPGALGDAVNLRTLNDRLDQIQTQVVAGPTSPTVLSTATTSNLYVYSTSTAALTLTTSMTDVPGASGTLNTTGKWWVTAVFDFNNAATDTSGLVGQLMVNGTAVAPQAIFLAFISGQTPVATVAQTWVVTGTTGWVVKLQGKKVAGAGASSIGTPHTSLAAVFIGP